MYRENCILFYADFTFFFNVVHHMYNAIVCGMCLDCVKNFQNADLIQSDDYKAVQLRFDVSYLN